MKPATTTYINLILSNFSVISKTGSIISNRLQAVLESSEEKDGQINAASTILKDENISSERVKHFKIYIL